MHVDKVRQFQEERWTTPREARGCIVVTIDGMAWLIVNGHRQSSEPWGDVGVSVSEQSAYFRYVSELVTNCIIFTYMSPVDSYLFVSVRYTWCYDIVDCRKWFHRCSVRGRCIVGSATCGLESSTPASSLHTVLSHSYSNVLWWVIYRVLFSTWYLLWRHGILRRNSNHKYRHFEHRSNYFFYACRELLAGMSSWEYLLLHSYSYIVFPNSSHGDF